MCPVFFSLSLFNCVETKGRIQFLNFYKMYFHLFSNLLLLSFADS